MYAVIMAGGSGTRLWPLSRKNKPKQFQPLVSDKALLAESVKRLSPLVLEKDIFISTTETLLPASMKLLPKIPRENFLAEPFARNTGPAVGLTTAILARKSPDETVATLWSDHHIGKPSEFRNALKVAAKIVEKNPNSLVTIGIKPTEPSTAYGYIQMNSESEMVDGTRVFKVKRFVEKPDTETAKGYVRSWAYLWNAGYFIFRAQTMLDLFKKHAPDIHKGLTKIQAALGSKDYERVLSVEFAKFPNVPVDTLIAEKAESMYVVPADLEWSDIGSWSVLHEILSGASGARVISKGVHISCDDESWLVFGAGKPIATVGLKDVIIVDTPDALLVVRKDKSQDVKKVIEELKIRKMDHLL